MIYCDCYLVRYFFLKNEYLQYEKRQLRNRMVLSVNDRIRKVEDDRQSLSMTGTFVDSWPLREVFSNMGAF